LKNGEKNKEDKMVKGEQRKDNIGQRRESRVTGLMMLPREKVRIFVVYEHNMRIWNQENRETSRTSRIEQYLTPVLSRN
jgi:hypothetical protein